MLTIVMVHDDLHIRSEILVLYKPKKFCQIQWDQTNLSRIMISSLFHVYESISFTIDINGQPKEILQMFGVES
jgi:hypothetical protein